jgi:hypothetical protein
MEVNVQLHALVALFQRTDNPLPNELEAEWNKQPFRTNWRKYLLPMSGIEPQFFGRPARTPVTILTHFGPRETLRLQIIYNADNLCI